MKFILSRAWLTGFSAILLFGLFIFILEQSPNVGALSYLSQGHISTSDSSHRDNRTALSNVTITSDINTEYLSGVVWLPSVEAWVHQAWPSLQNAKWIWKSYLVTPEEALNGTPFIKYKRTFDLPTYLESASGTLRITADNAYEVYFNGERVGEDGISEVDPCNPLYKSIESYQVSPKSGFNELIVNAVNYPDCNGNNIPQSNPAGVLFRLDITYQESRFYVFLPSAIQR